VSDAPCETRPSVLEQREHVAAMAFVSGPKWYAKRLLEFQSYPNRNLASKALIERSSTLLEESRARIVRSKNILAFSRSQRFVN
jgi:hypothetical protein